MHGCRQLDTLILLALAAVRPASPIKTQSLLAVYILLLHCHSFSFFPAKKIAAIDS